MEMQEMKAALAMEKEELLEVLRVTRERLVELEQREAAVERAMTIQDLDDSSLGTTELQDELRKSLASPVEKYFEHQQAPASPRDVLSQAVFTASQDDCELVFQAFDAWLQDVLNQKEPKDLVQVLYYRGQASNVPEHVNNSAEKTSYELIMSGAAPEEILESWLSESDDEDLELRSFTYPTPKRSVIDLNRSFTRRVSRIPGMFVVDAQDRDDTSPLRHRMSETRSAVSNSNSSNIKIDEMTIDYIPDQNRETLVAGASTRTNGSNSKPYRCKVSPSSFLPCCTYSIRVIATQAHKVDAAATHYAAHAQLDKSS